jgi:hypothetical protein
MQDDEMGGWGVPVLIKKTIITQPHTVHSTCNMALNLSQPVFGPSSPVPRVNRIIFLTICLLIV